VLQTIGTEWGRSIDSDLWINYAKNKANYLLRTGTDLVIITDSRFRDEILALKSMNACMVKIVAVDEIYTISNTYEIHTSETSQDNVPDFWYNWTINNHKKSGMKDLIEKTSTFMDKMVYNVKDRS
jgi:hypothetical protein